MARHDRRGINCPQVLRDYLKWGANPYNYGASPSSLAPCLPTAGSVEDPSALGAGRSGRCIKDGTGDITMLKLNTAELLRAA